MVEESGTVIFFYKLTFWVIPTSDKSPKTPIAFKEV